MSGAGRSGWDCLSSGHIPARGHLLEELGSDSGCQPLASEIGCRWDGLYVEAREREGRRAAWSSPGLWSFPSTGPDAVGYTAHSIPPFPGVELCHLGGWWLLLTRPLLPQSHTVTHNLGQGQAVLSALLGSWGCPLAEGWAPAFGYRFLSFMLGLLSSLPPWAGDAFLHGACSRPREPSWEPGVGGLSTSLGDQVGTKH